MMKVTTVQQKTEPVSLRLCDVHKSFCPHPYGLAYPVERFGVHV
jgi:hypothetical protein